MGCDIVFRFIGKGASEDGSEASPIILQDTDLQGDVKSTLNDVASQLYYNERYSAKRKELAQTLKTQKYLGFYKVTEDVLNTEGIIGNTNLSELKSLYPDIEWNECSDIPEILFVKNLSINGQKFTGRILEDGREIFIIEDDDKKYGLKKFSTYLYYRNLINTMSNEINKDEQLIKAASELKFSSPKQLMNDFILNPKNYTKSPFKDLLELSKKTYLRSMKINDEFTSLIIGNNQYENRIVVKKSTFADKLIKYHNDELKEKDINKQDIKSKENEDLIRKLFDEFFINDLSSGERYILESVNDTELILKRVFPTFENVYGWNFQTVSDLLHIVKDDEDPEIVNGEYRGYIIYHRTENGKKEYFCSLDSITNKSMSSESFKSIKDVKTFIDKQYNLNKRIDQTANIGFKQRSSSDKPCIIDDSGYHPEGTVIKSINIDIDSKVELCKEDSELFYGRQNTKSLLSKMKEEYKKLLPENVINEFDRIIDTTEKAGIFLYLINQEFGGRENRDFSDLLMLDKLNQILTTIETKSHDCSYYYIEKSDRIVKKYNGYERQAYRYTIIPVKKRGIEYNKIYERPSPIIDQLIAASELLSKKFGLQIQILNSSEVPEDIPTDAKAWIRNGIIYVNGTTASTKDLFHEYTHLLLGIIKSQNFELYEKMIDKIRNSKDGRVRGKRLHFMKTYENLSETDVNEEIFADMFGEYLAGKDLSFFEGMKEIEEEATKIMTNSFPGMSEVWVNAATKGRVTEMFSVLSTLISANSGKISFGDNSQYRKASRLIEKWIKNNTVIEEC